MTESDFRVSLQKGLTSQGCFAYKIPDLARAMVKPCDLIIGCQRQLWLIECKIKKFDKEEIGEFDLVISPSLFRPHQLPTLEAIEERGQGYGFVATCIVNEKHPRFKEAWLTRVTGLKHYDYRITKRRMIDLSYPLIYEAKVGWTLNLPLRL